ncbi:UvrD-helicase domain-containing protein [Pimelobacter simplex]|uniref:UvrD-helicase domain-containing protein n=1 Tax=Nocardioides simplex TaxID=2045 RepID=UPI003AABD863
MKILAAKPPTPEQLKVLVNNRPGTVLIKGAAGSGKTTTAMLRLRHLTESWISRATRLDLDDPVRVLVLTYNRTLQTYIQELASEQVAPRDGLELKVATFGKWARDLLPPDQRGLLEPDESRKRLRRLASALGGDINFHIEEAQYVLDRFLPSNLDAYLTARRTGRGLSPRMEQPARQRLLNEVVVPYRVQMDADGLMDWNDIALAAYNDTTADGWDVIVVDEAQDFSANQARATHAHLNDPGSLTFVMDAVQRIYPRSFTWKEAGIDIETTYTLTENYRNTRQIAAFARSLVDGVPLDDDGALPNFDACHVDGPVPVVFYGLYNKQIDAMLAWLEENADLETESVAFLQPKGGRWFDFLRQRLNQAGIEWADLTRASAWPQGSEAVALSTLYSAKGLEFDHVFLPGLNAEVTPHGPGTDDTQLDNLRRLVAMGVGRARKTASIGTKPSDPSTVLSFADPETFERRDV